MVGQADILLRTQVAVLKDEVLETIATRLASTHSSGVVIILGVYG